MDPLRRLVLVRHAKAEAGDGDDIDRDLTGHGRRDAAAVGQWLVAARVAPDAAVVSPARRARRTWKEAAAALAGAPSLTIDDRIYDNDVSDLVSVAREASASVTTLVLVGHNPSMEELAGCNFPTASVAVLGLDCDWHELSPARLALVDFATCRG